MRHCRKGFVFVFTFVYLWDIVQNLENEVNGIGSGVWWDTVGTDKSRLYLQTRTMDLVRAPGKITRFVFFFNLFISIWYCHDPAVHFLFSSKLITLVSLDQHEPSFHISSVMPNMVGCGLIWFRIVRDGLRWSRMVQYGRDGAQLFQIIQDCQNIGGN